LRAIWADKPRDWFVVGDNGEIWQERGSGWTAMASPRTDDLHDVFGSDSAFVFTVGDADSILFYDGFTWSPDRAALRRPPRGAVGHGLRAAVPLGRLQRAPLFEYLFRGKTRR
jgi:hypothetical protein